MYPALYAVAAACGVLATSALADEVIYSTGTPYGGPMGVTGFDIYERQSAAIRFTPTRDCTLTQVSLWVMGHTSPGQQVPPAMSVSIRADGAGSPSGEGPAGEPLTEWLCITSLTPYEPELLTLECEQGPRLLAGVHYWVVAESDNEFRSNAIWNWSGQDAGYIALRGTDNVWSCGPGVALTVELHGVPCPSPDFDNDTDAATDADIEAFFACLAGNCCATCNTADVDQDGDTATDADIEAFFRALAGGC